MTGYIIKRLLFFIPTLLIISLMAFIISLMAPGDPAERNVQTQTGSGYVSISEQRLVQKKIWRKKLGLDLPVFYISIQSFASPDTLHRVYPEGDRKLLERLIRMYGNWPEISRYFQSIRSLETASTTISPHAYNSSPEKAGALNEIKFACLTLFSAHNPGQVTTRLNQLQKLITENDFMALMPYMNNLRGSYNTMKSARTVYKNYIPSVSFNSRNQFHRWIFGDGNWLTGKDAVFSRGIIRGDFGTSYITGLPVMQELVPSIKWSLLFAAVGIVIAYFISIPVGIFSAASIGGAFDRISNGVLLMLYSMPVFWVATLLLLMFANPSVLQIFPASGVMPVTGYGRDASPLQIIMITIPYMILPLFCMIYGVVAYLSRSVRISMIGELNLDYIKTARAKGLPEKAVLMDHAFKNSRLPLITLLANVLPMSIAGSLIIESIFTIPGMGFQTLFAIHHQNYPVVIAIFTLTGFMSLTGYLLADILYAWTDPRISFRKAIG